MNPREISILDYNYELPDEKIAYRPLEQRDQSRLLVYKSGNFQEDIYRNIAQHLPANALLAFNNTRVVEARIIFTKPTGGQIEVFCIEPDARYPDITTAMLEQGKVYWNCLIGGASKWKPGQVLTRDFEGGTLEARFIEKKNDSFLIELSWEPTSMAFAEVLHAAGLIPLPPYIKRKAEQEDAGRYQTIYARHDGSVAAPTAGLHFTKAIFEDLSEKNITPVYVTLHVGAGTFKPVKAGTMEGHDMHAEFIDVPITLIRQLLEHHKDLTVAVGTTSLRTLESLYWIAAEIHLNKKNIDQHYELRQWFSWDNASIELSKKEALEIIENYMRERNLERLITRTRLLIMPGYIFRMVDALVTNFHQPQSTLLLLVAAFIGDDWKKLYDHALQHNFRFLSYGDGCLLFRNS